MWLILFLALFFVQLSADDVNIISYKNGVGLDKDVEILSEELTKLGYTIHQIDYRESKPVPKADINLFIEVVNDYFFPYATKNYLIPNPEWYVFPREWIPKFDKILCKTREAERIFSPLNSNTTFLSFTSRDCFDPSVKKNYKEALHLVGASIQKSTPLVLETWAKNPQLPFLSVVRHTGNSDFPKTSNLELLYKYFSNEELRNLQNRCGLHICPSITEGFGHYIVEAMSAGSVVITTGGPPMTEMILDKRCLVAPSSTGLWRMATCYMPNPEQLKEVTLNLVRLPEEDLREIGRKNREWYLENDRFFKKKIVEIFKPKRSSWELTDFVWNLGMASTADFGPNRNPNEYFKGGGQENLFDYRVESVKRGDVLWLRCSQVPQFCAELLPKLKEAVVLVINDGDESFPASVSSKVDVEKLLASEKIIHVFAQNCDYTGGRRKVSHLPIGIDFHTLAYKGNVMAWWGQQASPKEQEANLKKIIQGLQPTKERKCRAFVDFQHCDSMRGGDCKRDLEFGEDRTSIFQKLKKTDLIDYSNPMPRNDLWLIKGQYAFSISPPGNGYDCHRTWEDLVLGCIVIVKTSPIDPLFEGLPVVIVKDWSEITEKNMQKWLAQYGDAFTNPVYREKLTNQYWLDKIKRVSEDPTENEIILTKQTSFPPPFTYFDHLYFDTGFRTFYGVGENIDTDRAIAPDAGRAYSFKSVSYLSRKNIGFIDGTTLFLFEANITKSYLFHFFHLLEHLVGIWSLYGDENNEDIKTIVLDGISSNWEGPNKLNKHLIEALFPNAVVITWDNFIKMHDNKTICLERAVLSDRAVTLNNYECTKINKMLGSALPFLSEENLINLADKVHTYSKTKKCASDTLRVTYTKRGMPRTLTENLEKQLLSDISKIPNVSVIVADFCKLSFQEQVNLIGNTDVLIGVHGNGLSHILFLPENAAAIEIFPPDTLALDYRLYADARGVAYLGISSNLGPIGKEVAYQTGPFGDVNKTIERLDFAPILSFIGSCKERLLTKRKSK